MSLDSMALSYIVNVEGLEQTKAAAENAAKSADIASNSVNNLQSQGTKTLPLLLTGLRTINSVKNAVEQTQKTLASLNPEALLFLLLDLAHVAMNLTHLMKMLRESTILASAAQAVLDTLAGAWYLIPLAIAAGALVASSMRSMQAGGPVNETGVYILHRGEYVTPASRVQNYGPIYVSFRDEPSRGGEMDAFIRELGPRLAREMRRGY
jgi:hypothetical protein